MRIIRAFLGLPRGISRFVLYNGPSTTVTINNRNSAAEEGESRKMGFKAGCVSPVLITLEGKLASEGWVCKMVRT